MTTLRITDNSAGAQNFLEYARNLPFIEVEEQATPRKRTVADALADGGVTVDVFFDKLDALIDKWED